MKKIMKKILYPKKTFGFLLFNFSFGLLIYVFCRHLEETFLAYLSYLLSFYSLILFCIWFYQVCQFSNDFIKATKIYHLYKTNFWLVTKSILFSSFIINLIYGIFKLIIGIYYQSWWFITFAIYYLILCFVKFSLVRNIKEEFSSNLKKEYEKLKLTGMILLFLNFILIGMVILIVSQNKQISYDGFLIYLVALYDFYLIISAIVKVIKYRKNHRPILVASKCLNLTVAMISMISLEVAMVSQFGNGEDLFKLIMTGCMGFAICLINSIMSIYMIVKSNQKLKQKK